MSKSEILEEIAKLPPEERQDLYETLWDMEGRQIAESQGPTEEEKALLDRELEEYEKNPWQGITLEELEGRLRQKE